jgi:hypothetical protein
MGALLAIDRLRQVQGNLPSDQSSKTINIAATIAKVTATAKAIWVPAGWRNAAAGARQRLGSLARLSTSAFR